MNQIVLVGRIKEKPVFQHSHSGNKFGVLVLEVNRSGSYHEEQSQKDIFQVTVWRNLAEQCESDLKEGMSIGVKGRLVSNNYLSDDKVKYRSDIIAEKISRYTA